MIPAKVLGDAVARDHLTNGLSFRKAAGLTVVRDWDEPIGYVHQHNGLWMAYAYRRGGFMGDRENTFVGAYTLRRKAANVVAATMRGNGRCDCHKCAAGGAA
jgi:hypothetical protein